MQRVLIVVLAVAALAALWWFGFREADAPVSGPGKDPGAEEADGLYEPIDIFEVMEKKGEEGDGPALEAKGSEPAPAETPPVAMEDGLTLVGRVLGKGRRPVAGAKITLASSYDTGLGERFATSGADGRYRLTGVRRPELWASALLRANTDERAGQAWFGIMANAPDEIAVADIVLGPAHTLHARVMLADEKPAAGARVFVESRQMMQMVPMLDTVADADGHVRVPGLPTGGYRVLATRDGHGRGKATTSLPAREEGPVVVALGPERVLVALVVDKDTREPIEGATVTLEEHIQTANGHNTVIPWHPAIPDLVTSAEGRVAIPGIGLEDGVKVNATAEGYPPHGLWRTVSKVPQDQVEVEIALHKLRTVRWKLAEENPHAPADGTELELELTRGAVAASLPTKAWVEGKEIVAEGCSPDLFHATVIAPDGAFGRLFVNRDEGSQREVTFMRPHAVTVRVMRGDGSPASGMFITARNQGNNTVVDPTPLDENGELTLDVRYEWLLDFFVNPRAMQHGGRRIGSLDLSKQDGGLLEATLPALRTVVVHVTIDGKPALPNTFHMFGVIVTEEDPEAGTVTVEMSRAGTPNGKLSFNAEGFLPVMVDVPPADGDEAARVDVALKQGGTVLLRVKRPADGRLQVAVMEAGAMNRGMRFGPGVPKVTQLGEENGWIIQRVGPLAAGSYEAIDGMSQARSKAVEVVLGEESRIDLDLSKVGMVRGTVEVPTGFTAQGARVRIHREGQKDTPYLRMQGAFVRQDGTFQLRVPGDREVELRAFHPQLIPASQGGSVTVKEPRDGVVLRLATGGSATFRVDGLPEGIQWRHSHAPVNVYLYKGEPTGKADQILRTKRDGDVLSVAGFEPGTYHVFVDVRKRALVDLGKRELGKATDLGTITPKKGASLIIRVKVKEGQDPPRIYASAWCTEGVSHTRYINSRGEAEVRIPGLSAGTYKLNARSMAGFGSSGVSGGGVLDETVTCDGTTDIVRELDLR